MSDAPEVSITFDQKALEEVLRRGGKAVEADVAKLALKGAQVAEGYLRKQIMAKLAQGPTGALARSVRSQLVENAGGGVASAIAGADTVYAEIQDQGGVIQAKGTKLAVPLRVGQPPPKGKWPRDYQKGELFLVVRKGGKDALLVSPTRGPQFVLKTSVRLHGVGYRDAALADATQEIEKVLAEGLQALLDRVLASGGSSPP